MSWLEYRVVQADRRVGQGGCCTEQNRSLLPCKDEVLGLFQERRGLRIIELPLKVMLCFVVEGIVAKGGGGVSGGKLTARLFLRLAYHTR